MPHGVAASGPPSAFGAVLELIDATSPRFVLAPSRKMVVSDLLIGLRRFKHSCRWREFWLRRQRHQADADSTFPGLRTNLAPVNAFSSSAPTEPSSPKLMAFLKEVDRELLSAVLETTPPPVDSKSAQLRQALDSLAADENIVLVPTDKTASYVEASVADYKMWMNEHLAKTSQEIPREQLVATREEGLALLLRFGSLLSKKEWLFVEQSLDSRAIPTPFLLVKDHKPRRPDGSYPSRLVVPAQNFASGFPKLGYLGIKNLFKRNQVPYCTKVLVNSYDLKEKLALLPLSSSTCTIMSLDIEDMYPSITFDLVKQAVIWYSSRFSRDDKAIIRSCLTMLQFGMSHTYLTFGDRYFVYAGTVHAAKKGLTIGGFESAWLADLVAGYLLERTASHFADCFFHGIYRDDGFVVFRGRRDPSQIGRWLRRFQREIDSICGKGQIRFSCSLWSPGVDLPCPNPCVSLDSDDRFHYLDVDMFWGASDGLEFKVGMKPNQVVPYLDSSSTHPPACFRAVVSGVLDRLTRLTTESPSLVNTPLDSVYPIHATALRVAGYAPSSFPTLGDHSRSLALRQANDSSRRKRARWKRQVFFCVGYSNWWRNHTIHRILTRLRRRFGLSWLRLSMSYHRFQNVQAGLRLTFTRRCREAWQAGIFASPRVLVRLELRVASAVCVAS